MTKRRRYDDDFRANAVLMLEAAGYPDTGGALTAVAKRMKVPLPTLHRWARAKNNPPPSKLVNEKRQSLKELLENELRDIFKDMPDARKDAVYRDLGWVGGVIFDKLQLLEGKPTWRVEVVNMLKEGIVTPQQVKGELGDELAIELFNEAGVDVS